jgi:TrmH family RNA methyltransferase
MKFDELKKLHQKKYRTQFEHFLVEGEHLILELAKAHQNIQYAPKVTLYITQEHQAWAAQFSSKWTLQVLSQKQMSHISDTKSPQGMVALVPLPATEDRPTLASKHQKAIYLHEIQDPGNLGTILRSLAWFGNFHILLSPNSVDPFNSKVVRSSMGAIFHVPMQLDVTLEDLAQQYSEFAYLDMNGEGIQSPSFKQFDCYLFGNEARGVPTERLQALNAKAFTIKGSGAIDSLNLASAVNICAYQLTLG